MWTMMSADDVAVMTSPRANVSKCRFGACRRVKKDVGAWQRVQKAIGAWRRVERVSFGAESLGSA